MTRKRLVMEVGMGTDLHGQDYTKAAIRGLRDALWHNSLSVAPALGYSRDDMQVDIEVAVAQPEKVDKQAVAAILPYGKATVNVTRGGLDVPNDDNTVTIVIANVAALVYLDIKSRPDQQDQEENS